MSKNIVFEGWLTKSPPTKRIFRTKWQKRWFALRQSGELPGQYFLDYYSDRNCRRHKGTINLDLCEQVDAGLHMERSGNGTLDPKIRGSVFTIQTQTRTYHLEAECEAEMEKWVDVICRVCGLRSTDDDRPEAVASYQNNTRAASNDHYHRASETTGPYIPISECITGVRDQDDQRHGTGVGNHRSPLGRISENKTNPKYLSQPQIRITAAELSENESNPSEDDCKSLGASQSNMRDWAVAKTFTKLTIKSTQRRALSEDGPPVPPRPPKTLTMNREMFNREVLIAQKISEPVELTVESVSPQSQGQGHPWLRIPRRSSQSGAPTSPKKSNQNPHVRFNDEEDEYASGQISLQYCNMPTMPNMPPAVDRNLKPRPSSHNMSQISHISGQPHLQIYQPAKPRSDVLQYLDLDLQAAKPDAKGSHEMLRKRTGIIHGKSRSDSETPYKTVDFLKTEAFNITRQDAEASRNLAHLSH
ncbi:uncharacterized protein LOC101746155 isoform X2 [Bombyx mori]|uniref:PH domain-containing protein n=1 Tax=Bombyx mori TaxID=7091 RepID=A0A8R2ASV3_BOMMO|nr:uncharacterized protein LOC101746155 isoform X2 [Bombyx mori]